ADLGVSCGNGKGQIFRQGQVITTVPEHQIIDALLDKALALAEEPGTAEEDAS
ncbi:4-hydroxy-3-methylbut-2-en-1-yl diphosphate synthase, partial [Streptomyces syringium]